MKQMLDTICQQWIEQYRQLAVLKDLVETNMNELKKLIEANNGTIPNLKPIETIINKKSGKELILPNDTSYEKKWNWEQKIAFILNQKQMPMSAKEIANKIRDFEPENDTNITKAITMAASKLGLNKKLVVTTNKGNNQYGLF